jgi:hypothetical protein
MYRGGDLSTKGRDLSTEGETRLLRGRLVYGGGDSSTEVETHLLRGRLVYGAGGSSTEGETRLLEDVIAISSYPPTPFSHTGICSGNVHLLRPDGPAEVPGNKLVQTGGQNGSLSFCYNRISRPPDSSNFLHIVHRNTSLIDVSKARAVSGLSTGRTMKDIPISRSNQTRMGGGGNNVLKCH